MYQDGTATGKLPAVITATTPTGLRNVNSCLSGISDGTVCPYSRRPSPRKKSQVSMISCTSPRASAAGLPISRVTIAASRSLLAAISRPTFAITCPRTGAGMSDQARCASYDDRQASTNTAGPASSTVATRSLVFAGLVDA